LAGHFTIELEGLRFFGSHGMYQEEMLVGNEFEVNVALESKAPKKTVHSIEQTINYVEVYRIIQEVFSVRRQLLETCAMEIADAIQQQFPELVDIRIKIKKVTPPITNFTGAVAVTYSKSFKEK
jgi:7,8-dihydroneopterin aldolase/epimerase/oxygenase